MRNKARLPRAGQKIGREERISEFERKYNAKVVRYENSAIEDVKESEAEAEKRIEADAEIYLSQIRSALTSDFDKIQCSCCDRRVVEAIKKQLPPGALEKVVFNFFDVPIPSKVVYLQ